MPTIFIAPTHVRFPAVALIAAMASCLLVAPASRAQVVTNFTFRPNTPAAGQGVIHVTGVGMPPRTWGPRGQLHLMAERAAIVGAYRQIMLAVGQGEEIVTDRMRYITTTGFIRGAELMEKRYYPDGRVEVDMMLRVDHPPTARAIQPPPPPAQATPERVERFPRQVTEEEWLQLYAQPKDKKP